MCPCASRCDGGLVVRVSPNLGHRIRTYAGSRLLRDLCGSWAGHGCGVQSCSVLQLLSEGLEYFSVKSLALYCKLPSQR